MARAQLAREASNEVLQELENALQGGLETNAIESTVRILRARFDAYHWVGVYLVKGDRLALEAYAGDSETEHTSIPIGQGICGAAAKAGETIVVPDVRADPRYLMCFPSTRSEIVVPIRSSKKVLGEIDIDSDRLGAFGPADRKFLEMVASLLARFLEKN